MAHTYSVNLPVFCFTWHQKFIEGAHNEVIELVMLIILCLIGEWLEEGSETAEEGKNLTPEPAATEIREATQVAKVKAKPKDLSAQLKKEHVNIVFIGHVDAGKSTIGGRVL